MSTSRNRQTPIEYMGSGGNVLWEMHPSLESDEAFHRGADVALLSQFESEAEVLFPPCTLLLVREHSTQRGKPTPTLRRKYAVERESQAEDTKYLEVEVVPSFI